jgi:hypothetical protein
MPAYVFANIRVHDSMSYEHYKQIVPGTIERFGGRYLARGGRVDSLRRYRAGPHHHPRVYTLSGAGTSPSIARRKKSAEAPGENWFSSTGCERWRPRRLGESPTPIEQRNSPCQPVAGFFRTSRSTRSGLAATGNTGMRARPSERGLLCELGANAPASRGTIRDEGV